MATCTTNALSLSSSSAFVDGGKVAHRQPASASPQCVSLPTLPPLPVHSQNRVSKTTAHCRKIGRNVVAMATGEAPAAAVAPVAVTPTTSSAEEEVPAPVDTTELLQTIQNAWDKVEDKYAVSSLAVAGGVALWGSAGMISAIDRLPLFPGIFELVGIGYTGWFAYQNIVFKPDREALLQKIKNTYKEIIGSS